MRRLLPLLLVCLPLAAPGLSAQEGPAVFDSREWDFGAIREADGPVRHGFLVFNHGDRPLRIERAIPGCSCISAELPRTTLAPGESATVDVVFTPAGAAGPVQRTVEIYADGNRSLGILSVSADVLPADRSIQERYPVVLAEGLYASRSAINFGYLERGRASAKAFFLANASGQPLALDFKGLEGSHFRVSGPDSLAPGEEARVEVSCDAPADPAFFATLRATLEIVPRGGKALRTLPLSGLCLTQAPESPDAPRLRNAAVRLRRKALSRKWQGALEITNDGASDLLIHAVELPEGFRHSTKAFPLRIAPGRSLAIGLEAEGFDRPGKKDPRLRGNARPAELSASAPASTGVSPRLTVFSNDPLRPAKEISINIP